MDLHNNEQIVSEDVSISNAARIAKIMADDKIISDTDYWEKVFSGETDVNISFIEEIIERYSCKLNRMRAYITK